MGDKEKFEPEINEDPMSYSTAMPSDWQFGGANLVNTHVGLVPVGHSMNISRGGLIASSSCSSASMVDSSYGPNFWAHAPTSQNLGYCDVNVLNNSNSSSPSNTIGIRKDGRAFSREMGCNNPANFLLKGDAFLPNGPVLPQSSSHQFPADSAFIQRAARFSCFSGGSFGDMVNSFGIPQSMMGLYAKSGVSGEQAQESNLNVGEAAKDVSIPSAEGNPYKNDKRSEGHVKSQSEAKQDGAKSSSDDGAGGQDDSPMLEGTSGEPSTKGVNLKKRKRSGQDADNDKVNGAPELVSEAVKDNSERDQPPTSTTKTSGKNAKQGSQASDSAKDEYIHVRARRGQATNSHSLAERVRREKISERMKFLQDLVPGCSKVTGKAVMLDEIINYVQSLQRQVEFLSMKLATVNPRLDFNVEGLLTKDILHQRPGPSFALGFSPDMPMAFPALHPSQPGLVQPTIPGMASSTDIFRRTVHPQLAPLTGGFKEPSQVLSPSRREFVGFLCHAFQVVRTHNVNETYRLGKHKQLGRRDLRGQQIPLERGTISTTRHTARGFNDMAGSHVSLSGMELPDVWEDELHNVVQRGFATTAPQSSQDADASVPAGQMKVEL